MRAGVDGVADVLLVRIHAQDEDARAGELLQDLARHLEAVHLRHRHVEDDHVGLLGAQDVERLGAVAGFAHDEDVLFVLENPPEALADQGVIVDEDDADGVSGRLAGFGHSWRIK